MFKHAFHGGPAVEIFTITGKNPLEKWKTTGSITKSFDNTMKGFIYTLDNTAKMQLPKDEKEFLGLIQPFLVFQIFIPLGKNLHIEVGITDSTKVIIVIQGYQTKRRLIFHSGAKEIVANPLHARIPISHFRRNQWLNLSLDIFSFAHNCFKGVNVRSIDLIVITASCKLRRIFTMRNPLYDDTIDSEPAGSINEVEFQQMINELMVEEQRDNLPFDYVPKSLQFPQNFMHYNQFMFPHRVRKQIAFDDIANNANAQAQEVGVMKKDPKVQLAFGQRIAAAPLKQQQQLASNRKTGGGVVTKQGVRPQSNQKVKATLKEASEQDDFYTPLNSDLQVAQDQDYYQDEEKEQNDYEQNLDSEEKQKQNRKRITKEELKEETHFLYLNNSDEEQENEFTQYKKELHDKNKDKLSNPWDNLGRQAHDSKPTALNNKNMKQSPSKKTLANSNSKNRIQPFVGQKIKQQQLDDVDDNQFYQPYDQQDQIKANKIRLDSDDLDDQNIYQQDLKVQQLSTKVSNIENKYSNFKFQQPEQFNDKTNPQKVKSPEIITKAQRRTGGGFNKQQKTKLKKDDKDDEMKKLSNYGNFNIDQWDTNLNDGGQQVDLSGFIEEAFDLNHQNLINYANNQQQSDDEALIQINPKQRQSKEFKENPLFIEFELNNDEDETDENDQNQENTKLFKLETGQSYARLESSRKEERRPFSPPFKVQASNIEEPINDFQKQLAFLKVQRTNILRDSLDNSIPHNAKQQNLPAKATVENEDGELLEVIFDPVLQCYYDPRSNSYYELKEQ